MSIGAHLLVFRARWVARTAARRRRQRLEGELAAFRTPAERRDLAATLDRYPDAVADELRRILASQALVADRSARRPW